MKTIEQKQRKAKTLARSLGAQLKALSRDMNKAYTLAENVSPYVMTHWVDTQTGEQGLADLIRRILKDNGAEFPANVGETTNKAMALNAGMTANEIIAEVQTRFSKGSKRHKYGSIHTFLCQRMSKAHIVKGVVVPPSIASLKQSSLEDAGRKSNKPQKVWFLIA